MGLYDFKPRFVKPILRGEKTHTIRAVRKYPDEPGDTMHLYTGLRTKKAKLLMRVPCVKVEEIKIWPVVRALGTLRSVAISIDGITLDDSEQEALARRDGFKDFADMMAFWNGRIPFTGNIFHWINVD